MKGYEVREVKVSEIQLDQKNPRFPPVANQREAIQIMLEDQGQKLVSLASDIYQNGLNPSSRLILFTERGVYIDGDGNRRLTALKLLETPHWLTRNQELRDNLNPFSRRRARYRVSLTA